MPELPTITVSQAHFDRIVAAFPGVTGQEKVAAYNAWLINHLIDVVEASESRAVEQIVSAERDKRMAAIRASLPQRQPYPPTSTPV